MPLCHLQLSSLHKYSLLEHRMLNLRLFVCGVFFLVRILYERRAHP